MFLKQLSFSSAEWKEVQAEKKEAVKKRGRGSIRAGVTIDEKRRRDGGREESLCSFAVH